ncbi:MAG: TetR/AcrR family transcriptional regulator [Candidatus Azotimanducaceae bacterium WSBS_2022_MAG_OTU7]
MLEAVVELIVDRGPAATSLKEVGLKAGYSRGLAGQRFGSKDKLFAFVLRQVGDSWLAQLKQTTNQQTGLVAIQDALDEHYSFCVEAPNQMRAFYTLWFESVNAGSELAELIGNIHNRRHQDVVTWITTGMLR